MTDIEANDLLPKPLKTAVNDSVTLWDSYYLLNRYNKLCKTGRHPDSHAQKLANELLEWDNRFCMRGFEPRRGFKPKMISSFEECGIAPIYSRNST